MSDQLVFSHTQVEFLDPEGKKHEVLAGDVWRHPQMHLQEFCDELVLGIAVHSTQGVWVKVARPYAYVSCAGTTGPTHMLGAEVYEVPIERFVAGKRLCTARYIT